jgi:sulfite reductase alpha subunit-like flavoprotein
VWNWLNALGGYLYVCGSTQMGKDVEAAVLSIATEVGGA